VLEDWTWTNVFDGKGFLSLRDEIQGVGLEENGALQATRTDGLGWMQAVEA